MIQGRLVTRQGAGALLPPPRSTDNGLLITLSPTSSFPSFTLILVSDFFSGGAGGVAAKIQ